MIFQPKGVCSNAIDVEMEEGIIKSVKFTGGCTMLALFFRHKYFMLVILTLLFCSILCQILLGVLYRES